MMRIALSLTPELQLRLEKGAEQVSPQRVWQARVSLGTSNACLLAGMLFAMAGELAYSRTQTQEQLHRALTLAERAAYQFAIEDSIGDTNLPKRIPGEPPLDAIVSQRQSKTKWRVPAKSQLVTERRGSPITGSELQTEMERMATHTRTAGSVGERSKRLATIPLSSQMPGQPI